MYTIVSTMGTSALEKFSKAKLPNDEENELHVKGNANEERLADIKYYCSRYNHKRLKQMKDPEKADASSGQLTFDYELLIARYDKHAAELPPHAGTWKKSDWFTIPAETASILRMVEELPEENAKDYRIILLLTDTSESLISAQINEMLLRKYGFTQVETFIAEGFQMEDLQVFNEKGIEAFMKQLDQIKAETEQPHKHLALNVTGGYKSFIPFVTSIASFNKLNMYYIFEEAVYKKNSLVKIPYVPTFNTVMAQEQNVIIDIIKNLESNQDINTFIAARDEIEQSLNSALKPGPHIEDYTNFILSFFELIDNDIKLSALGKIYFHYFLKGNEARKDK